MTALLFLIARGITAGAIEPLCGIIQYSATEHGVWGMKLATSILCTTKASALRQYTSGLSMCSSRVFMVSSSETPRLQTFIRRRHTPSFSKVPNRVAAACFAASPRSHGSSLPNIDMEHLHNQAHIRKGEYESREHTPPGDNLIYHNYIA